ncbi:MAG: sulfite exporter TauE/SafE family protein [Oscillospiraceae bacterium]|nr:sulfite exporter TauE/SafE family protein [Oscillospiraceae bacterium]
MLDFTQSLVPSLLFFLVGLIASALGAVSGLGGGVIIKPALDILGLADAAVSSLFSGCTVLVMCVYTTVNAQCAVRSARVSGEAREKGIDWRVVLPLAGGAVIGGAAGKWLFQRLAGALSVPAAGRAQAICLAAVMGLLLLFMLCRKRIKTHEIRHPALCVPVGAVLGACAGFLGIGGGPLNMIALLWLFGMETKSAAKSSLAVMIFSQGSALAMLLLAGDLPVFPPWALALMLLGGFLGGETGRRIRKRLSNAAVDHLLAAMIAVIIMISAYNAMK